MDLDKAVEHGMQRERTRNLSQMAALKSEAELAKKELAEEKEADFLIFEGYLRFEANRKLAV